MGVILIALYEDNAGLDCRATNLNPSSDSRQLSTEQPFTAASSLPCLGIPRRLSGGA
jgi:hypothetical protein